MRNGIKVELFGEFTSILKASRTLGIGGNSIRDRIKKLHETPQQACDHFIRKNALKSIQNSRCMIKETLQDIAA